MHQTNYTCYLIQGTDAKAFLQGQITRDMECLDAKNSFSAYCTAEGKIVGLFHLIALQEGYLMITNDTNPTPFINRLRMFILRSDCTIKPTEYQVFGTEDSPNSPVLPPFINQVFLSEHLVLWIAEPNEKVEAPLTAEQWHFKETLAGIPQINDTLRSQVIAPFLNIDWMNGISYDKGCYVGQEIIARLHYRGAPAKRSFVYYNEEAAIPFQPLELVSCTTEEGKTHKITIVRSAVWDNKIALIAQMAARKGPVDPLYFSLNNKTFCLRQKPINYD